MRLWLQGKMVVLAGVAFVALLAPAVAGADDDTDVRKAGRCTASSQISLRLRSDEDEIRVEVEIEGRRRGTSWSVVLVRERRIVFRGVVRARDGRTAKLRRTIDNWWGRDSIVVRASGPRNETCRVSASV